MTGRCPFRAALSAPAPWGRLWGAWLGRRVGPRRTRCGREHCPRPLRGGSLGWERERGTQGQRPWSPDQTCRGRWKLYTADLESGLHCLLRVELAAHRSLAGAELKTLKDFVTVLAKVCCGRGLAAEWVPRLRAPQLWGRADPSWTAAPVL